MPPSGKEAHRIKKMIQKVKRILSFDKANKLLWMPKAIAVASAYCYYDYFHTILKDLYFRFKQSYENLNEQKQVKGTDSSQKPELVRNKSSVTPPALSLSLLEQYVFNMVFKIPTPKRNKTKVIYPLMKYKTEWGIVKNLEIGLPSIEELPYVNPSHFEMLLEMINTSDIVTIFTHMLFE